MIKADIIDLVHEKIGFSRHESAEVVEAALDVLKEDSDVMSKNDDERFDGDFALMTGELAKMLAEVITALGGELREGEMPDLRQAA